MASKVWYKHPIAWVLAGVGALLLLERRASAAAEHWPENAGPVPTLPTGRVRFSAPHGAVPDPVEVALATLPLTAIKVYAWDTKPPADWPVSDAGARNRVDAIYTGPSIPFPGARVWTYQP